MSHLSKYSSEHLLIALTGFIQLQRIALLTKELGVKKARKLGIFPKNWAYKYGICSNINTLIRINYGNRHSLHSIRETLFKNCPSSGGSICYPVKEISYSFVNIGYHNSSPSQFWGNHAYADNRRQLIQECIEQLQTELRSRGIDV